MRLYILLVIVGLLIGCKTYQPSVNHVENIRISEQNLSPDNQVEEIIAPYREVLNQKMDEVIGELAVDLTKERPESDIGNWLADMLLSEAEIMYKRPVDFAVQNHGGVRVNTMAKGPITVGEIYEVMPFDNNVEILSGDSAQVHKFLNHIAKSGGWPVSRTLKFTIENEEAMNITIRGKDLDGDTIYSFALPDYIANGGSNSFFLRDYVRHSTGTTIRDAFINYLRKATKNGEIQNPSKDGRVTAVEETK